MANELPITSKRGKEVFSHEGFLYWFDSYVSKGGKKSWRCAVTLENGKRCKGRVYSNALTGEFLELRHAHAGHQADAAEIEIAAAKTTIKRRAVDTLEIPSQIRSNVLQGLSLAAQGRFPKQKAVTEIIQRKRKIENVAPAQPVNRQSIVIPENYQNYQIDSENAEKFLIADSGEGDDNRILIFGRESTKNWSHQIQKVYIDGTFSLSPPLFSQVFVIMAERNGFVFPILYALLPNKRQETYNRMIQLIRDSWPNFDPAAISLDFEKALINSFSNAFPRAALHGCLFHLVKNIKKHLRENDLMRRYKTDSNFALDSRMIAAMAFVPIEKLEDALDVLKNSVDDELIPVLDYFEDNYLGKMQRNNIRRQATFPAEIWSCYTRTIQGEARTNNYAEAGHRRLQAEFGVDHPNLWKFIDTLRIVQKSTDQIYESFVRGDEPPKKRQKYIKADARILNIVEEFETRNLDEYLRGLAQNFYMD